MLKFNLLNSPLNNSKRHANCYKTAWLLAMKAKDCETSEHITRVTDLSIRFGQYLKLSKDIIRNISYGVPLHDLGKLSTPDCILKKEDKLTDAEWLIMKSHVTTGSAMIMATRCFPEGSQQIVIQHHEKFDGTGYPFGLKGDDIYIGARLFSIVDAFDAMTNDRCYRLSRSYKAAIDEINEFSGVQFDPVLTKEFERFIS